MWGVYPRPSEPIGYGRPREDGERMAASLRWSYAIRRPMRLAEVGLTQLRGVARVALRSVAVGGARESAHRAGAARDARDLGRIRGRALVVLAKCAPSRASSSTTTRTRCSITRCAYRPRRWKNAAARSATRCRNRSARAWRAWEHRSLVVSRDPARGTLTITVEMPIEDGEVIAKAIERVADAGDAAIGLEFAAARKAAGVRELK